MPGQPRAEPVVEVAPQPPALLLQRRDRRLARLLQVARRGPAPASSGRAAAPRAAARARRRARSERSPGRSPTTSSASEPSRGKVAGVRVAASRTPPARGRPARTAAYGRTSASLITRSATTGSSPTCPATRLAAPSGSGRRPNSSSSTTPRSITCSGPNPTATSTPDDRQHAHRRHLAAHHLEHGGRAGEHRDVRDDRDTEHHRPAPPRHARRRCRAAPRRRTAPARPPRARRASERSRRPRWRSWRCRAPDPSRRP